MKCKVTTILPHINTINLRGPKETEFETLIFDSREVKARSLFFALKGIHTDGHNFVEGAVRSGASVIVHSDELRHYRKDVTYIQVNDTRNAMSTISACFWGFPAKEMKVIGVTGTDGKSTTTYLIYQLLGLLGYKCGFLSTVAFNTGETNSGNPFRQSTPEAPIIHQALRTMVNNGCSHVVLEATSHGLSQQTARLAGIEFHCGVFTNLSHEHLEFHRTMEQYLHDKANLFRRLSSEGRAVLNADDNSIAYIQEIAGKRSCTYGIKSDSAFLRAVKLTPTLEGTEFMLRWKEQEALVSLPLPGIFNVENFMAAILAVDSLMENKNILPELIALAPQLKNPEGRMTPVVEGQPFQVLVDYAHTPGSFEKLFPFLRKYKKGRLIAVFGSAGERDTEKRPIQGKIASEFSDIIILTNEDPRLEDELTILEDIAKGCAQTPAGTKRAKNKDIYLITDRREAIKKAFSIARQNDAVVLLGKGHEKNIFLKDRSIPWSDEQVARELLRELFPSSILGT